MMNYSISMKRQHAIVQKAVDVVQSILTLSECLPSNDFHQLRVKLRSSAQLVTTRIESSFGHERKIDRIRSMIKINGSIDECRDYLQLIESFRYANTKELIKELFEISRLLNEDYPEMANSRIN